MAIFASSKLAKAVMAVEDTYGIAIPACPRVLCAPMTTGQLNQVFNWCQEDQRPGFFDYMFVFDRDPSVVEGEYRIRFFFSDANLAFEFKMRWR